uniref:Uncharacterized protein n=1 Tax=Aegilops tauschii subsp. strangulata TaxID=200361 RepID=A0A453C5G6_AEGTS
ARSSLATEAHSLRPHPTARKHAESPPPPPAPPAPRSNTAGADLPSPMVRRTAGAAIAFAVHDRGRPPDRRRLRSRAHFASPPRPAPGHGAGA